MRCGLSPLLLLLLALLAASGADTISEFDRCVLGDCAPLTAAGGATVGPVGGAGDRTRDGASVAALKRSAEAVLAAAAELAEGSGAAESGGGAQTESLGAGTGEETPQIAEAAAEERTIDAGGLEEATADGEATTAPLPSDVSTTPLPPDSESPAAAAAEEEEAAEAAAAPEEEEEEPGSSSGGSGGGPGEDGGEDAEDPPETDWRTDHCSCDLTVSACDVDCCCDPDCGKQDRRAFSACQRRPSVTPDRRYCLQSDLIFSNNTEQRLERVEGGLFCIVRDNLVSRNSFTPVQPVTSSAEFDRLLSQSVRRHRYTWEAAPPPPPPAVAADRYRSGDLLWTVTDGTLQRWDVQWRGPVSAGLCDSVRPVRFLRPASTDCWLPADPGQLAPLDAHSLYRGLCLLTSPATAESGSLQELAGVRCGEVKGPVSEGATERPPALTVPIVPYLCDADHQNCSQVSEVPSPRVSSGRVLSALLSVLLVVEQRAGLVTAGRAELVLGAAPLGSSVRQQRAVQFRAPAGPPPRLRSGNPGYQRHRPLLAVTMVTNSSGEGPPRRQPAGEATPLLLPSPGRGGGCSADTRRWRPLAFGVDAAVSCRLEAAAGDCAALQRRVMETLLAGLPAALSDTALAAFGSAAPDGDWIPVLGGAPELSPETTPAGCRGLVTAARWRVLFAQAGAAWRPQARLVGVRLSFGRPGEVWAAGGRLAVTLQSSVTFQDVTRRPEPRFAQPPRVDISLPADFFYPFSARGAAPAGRTGSVPALTALLSAGLALRRAG